jgi:hypothetical protein
MGLGFRFKRRIRGLLCDICDGVLVFIDDEVYDEIEDDYGEEDYGNGRIPIPCIIIKHLYNIFALCHSSNHHPQTKDNPNSKINDIFKKSF